MGTPPTDTCQSRTHNEYEQPEHIDVTIADTWHSDQKGPITPQSVHGNKYTILFIDEFTGFVEAHHMRSLDETDEKYRIHRNRVLAHFNKKIKRLVCDGHSTYKSKVMEAMFNDDGTLLKMRAPYDPNGNALAERTIRTIIEMARTLIIGPR